MPVAHTPNADHPTYLRHFESALDDWLRTGILDTGTALRNLLMEAIHHPAPEDLKAASDASQDGSVAYNFDTTSGDVHVAPAIPHTEETVRAAEDRGEALPDAAYAAAGVDRNSPGTGPASPATTSTATASSEQLADTSLRPGATPDTPAGLPLYTHVGQADFDPNFWHLTDVETPDNTPLYTFADDKAGEPATGQSDQWTVYDGPIRQVEPIS